MPRASRTVNPASDQAYNFNCRASGSLGLVISTINIIFKDYHSSDKSLQSALPCPMGLACLIATDWDFKVSVSLHWSGHQSSFFCSCRLLTQVIALPRLVWDGYTSSCKPGISAWQCRVSSSLGFSSSYLLDEYLTRTFQSAGPNYSYIVADLACSLHLDCRVSGGRYWVGLSSVYSTVVHTSISQCMLKSSPCHHRCLACL